MSLNFCSILICINRSGAGHFYWQTLDADSFVGEDQLAVQIYLLYTWRAPLLIAGAGVGKSVNTNAPLQGDRISGDLYQKSYYLYFKIFRKKSVPASSSSDPDKPAKRLSRGARKKGSGLKMYQYPTYLLRRLALKNLPETWLWLVAPGLVK